MSFVAPKLDDRHFQDIVDEAKKRIPSYFDGWTDHNVSDPGVTMIELFAWMTEMILYRLNQVPDRHYIKFMELLGMKLREPQPASVPVTFWLSQPQETAVTIRAGTEVASTQTETEESIVFSTDADLQIFPPKLKTVRCQRQGQAKMEEISLRSLQLGNQTYPVFSDVPHHEDALYFGFENDLSQHLVGFEFECDSNAGGRIDPQLPPYVWEAATAESNIWQDCPKDIDEREHLNESGRIRIHLPYLEKREVEGIVSFWVRLRPLSNQEIAEYDGMEPYRKSPRINHIAVSSWGGTAQATQAENMSQEPLGRSDGTPNQQFRLQYSPVLPRKLGETLVVETVVKDENETSEKPTKKEWTEVPNFSKSGPNDTHFTLDGVTGEIRLGPAIREPHQGHNRYEVIKQYGAFPPRDSVLYFTRYRSGGGEVGNLQPGLLNTLKTAIPFINRVENRFPAEGGVDTEDIEHAKLRAPRLLQTRERAVTESDFEFLAKQALKGDVERIKCLQPHASDDERVAAGRVYILVIPKVTLGNGRIPYDDLRLTASKQQTLRKYLDERRLLTVRLDIREPAYHWVSVKVVVRADATARQTQVEKLILQNLYAFLNPVTGGPDKQGWPFGRDLFPADIYPSLQGIPGVQAIRGIELFEANETGQARRTAVNVIEVLAYGVIASGEHQVIFD